MKKKESPIQTRPHDFIDDRSGYVPLDTKVLVLPDYIDETSEGGIVLTTDTVQQNELAITEGIYVNCGQTAFGDWGEWADNIVLIPGARIVWAMYAGQMLAGDDGKMYRLLNDTDVVAMRIES